MLFNALIQQMFIENLLFLGTARGAWGAYKDVSCVPTAPIYFLCILSHLILKTAPWNMGTIITLH